MKLSKTQSSTTAEERERMKVVPYALAIGSIRYAMQRTAMCLATCPARGIRMIQECIIGQRSKLSLGIRKCFLDYGGDEEFGVKGYIDASFKHLFG